VGEKHEGQGKVLSGKRNRKNPISANETDVTDGSDPKEKKAFVSMKQERKVARLKRNKKRPFGTWGI